MATQPRITFRRFEMHQRVRPSIRLLFGPPAPQNIMRTGLKRASRPACLEGTQGGASVEFAPLTADTHGVNSRGRARRPLTQAIAELSLARVRRDAIERLSQHEVRWRALGALFVAGGLLA